MFSIIKIKNILMCFLVTIFCVGCCSWGTKHHHRDYDLSILRDRGITNIIPIAVIGSGPAGLSAGLYGARSAFGTVVFEGDKPGGLLTETTYVENWPGIIRKMGPEIMDDMREQGIPFGMKPIAETIEKVDLNQWPFVLYTSDGTKIHALTVIVATGASPRMLGIPGEQEYSFGKGVATCARCDALFYQGREVVVVGGGDSAVEDAMQLAPYASKVTVIVRKPAMRASATMQKHMKGYSNISVMYNVVPQEVLGNGEEVTGIRLLNNKENTYSDFKTDGVFIAIGHIPSTQLFKDFLPMGDHGYIEVLGRSQKTAIEGVYAAGDAQDSRYRQAGVAAGNGIKAGIDAATFLTDLGYNADLQKKLSDLMYKPRSDEDDDGGTEIVHVKTLNQLTQIVKNFQGLVFVDVYADYCPTCMQMLPVVDRAAQEYAGRVQFIKVDMDDEGAQSLLEKYNVRKVPHILIFKNGQLTNEMKTTLTYKELTELIDGLL